MKPLLYIALALGAIALVITAIFFTAYPLKYKKHIKEAAARYNVDPVLIASLINAESSFHPNAVSDKGAIGLMQIMPSTGEWVAQQMNIEFNSETLKEPRTNILIGTFYLRYLLDKFEDERTALIAYNAGEGKVMVWLTDGRYSSNIGEEEEGHAVLTTCPYSSTNKYVEKIFNSLNFYKFRF